MATAAAGGAGGAGGGGGGGAEGEEAAEPLLHNRSGYIVHAMPTTKTQLNNIIHRLLLHEILPIPIPIVKGHCMWLVFNHVW